MTIRYLAANRIQGLSSDTKPTSVPTNSTFWETDTFSLYEYNGATWLREEDQPELFTNKTIDAINNTLQNMLTSPFGMSFRRFGALVPGCTASGSLFGTLGGWSSSGTFSNVHDASEGFVDRFSDSTSGNILGYHTTATNQLITKRAWNTTFKVRAKASASTGRLYIGFSSNNTLPVSDTVLGDSEEGIIVGFSTATPDFTVFSNDDNGTMATATLSVLKDTDWHTYEIAMTSNGNIVCKLDSLHIVTILTGAGAKLPANDTILYGNAVLQLTESSAATFDFKGVSFIADK